MDQAINMNEFCENYDYQIFPQSANIDSQLDNEGNNENNTEQNDHKFFDMVFFRNINEMLSEPTEQVEQVEQVEQFNNSSTEINSDEEKQKKIKKIKLSDYLGDKFEKSYLKIKKKILAKYKLKIKIEEEVKAMNKKI